VRACSLKSKTNMLREKIKVKEDAKRGSTDGHGAPK